MEGFMSDLHCTAEDEKVERIAQQVMDHGSNRLTATPSELDHPQLFRAFRQAIVCLALEQPLPQDCRPEIVATFEEMAGSIRSLCEDNERLIRRVKVKLFQYLVPQPTG